MSTPYRLILVDDHYVVRMGMASSLNLEPDFIVVDEAESGAEALAKYAEHKPDLMIMDWRLPDQNGGEVIRKIRASFPNAKLLVLSAFDSEETIYQAIQSGAVGYLSKSSRRPELVQAIRLAAQGKPAFSGSTINKLATRMQRPNLSRRELEVIAELIQGNSNKEIASHLEISENTVKVHITHLLQKLKAKDRTHIASIALQMGLIDHTNQ